MFEDVNNFIENHLADNWTRTAIDYDNVEFNPVCGRAFIRLQIEWVTSTIISTGGRTKGEGYVDVSIFVPSNTGLTELSGMADELAAMFNRYEVGSLKFYTARVRRIGQQEEWYQSKVLVPFVYDKCYAPQLGYGGFCGYGN